MSNRNQNNHSVPKGLRFTFDELLSHCGNVSSPYWQGAWSEFDQRYGKFIYKKVAERCAALRPPRLKLQFSETVEDIVSEVQRTLFKDDCRAIREFRGRENENIFLAWLKQICYRGTRAYLRRHYKEYFSETNSESLDFLHTSPPDLEDLNRWEVYEEIVHSLRDAAARNARNTERDINIFLLYAMGGFSAEMFKYNPLLSHLGDRVVDVVVNRVRTKVRSNSRLSR
ncbi:MAG: hypothetical protein ACE5IY_18140 [bacterium]